jgi:3-phosphoshikimate 1-carboxyvinyltransferase
MTAAANSVSFEVAPGGALRGELRVPGDKSISHRAVMLAALAEGETEIDGFLEGADSLATLAAFRAMGVEADGPSAGRMRIRGVGLHGLRAPNQALDLGNSGTSMRLLAGLLAGQRFPATLIGDASLSQRPMRRVIDPLAQMGAHIDATLEGRAPLRVLPVQQLSGIDYDLPVASAQVKSCLLLAGLYARGRTCVREPAVTRDHTERMLSAFGYPLTREPGCVCLTGGGRLVATSLSVPADISSAAFFLVGASISPGSDLRLTQVGMNPTRTGVVNVLRMMGADIAIDNPRQLGGEPIADLHVRGASLRGVEVPEKQVPLAIDEFPALCIAAACADGPTVISGAAELRVKESDRIQAMADGLSALGVSVETRPDGMRIEGVGGAGLLDGAEVQAQGDHRIAMAFAMAALRAVSPMRIRDCANVETSFPGFAASAAGVGLQITDDRLVTTQ